MSDYTTYEVRVYPNGNKYWYIHGKRHREDGPAIERADGFKVWYLNGELHREDGPAIERLDGTKEWYLHDEKLTEEEHRQRTSRQTCNGKIVEIDGIKYKLTEV
tara:strand:+ start:918 stop:1229 length:312 start_codon:yes stop_codon:yes gene_type:complete